MRNSNICIAVLGVILGFILCAILTRYQNNSRFNETRNWSKLNLVLQQIDHNYVDSINYKEITDAAIVAVLSKLDPHSIYLPPTDLKESQATLSGKFQGIGIMFNVPNDTATVIDVIKGGPSEKIGIQKGDRIISVNNKNIAGIKMPQDSIVSKLKGPAGTKVAVTILRAGQKTTFDITRASLPLHSVDTYFMVNDTTGYLKLSKFSRTTYLEVLTALTQLKAQNIKKLIFDLRDNSGGYLDQALEISNLFLEKDRLIVFLEGLNRKREEYKANGKGMFKDLALDVLIDENSASSSEIFAGAMQDNDRARIIGRRSFGKGLVQEPIFFSDASGIRLTVARFYTPSGRSIQKPYASVEDYSADIYKRFLHGELTIADSVKIDTSLVYKTLNGRKIYGGGGIIPDIFVAIDTSKVSKFYLACNKKASQMRFASYIFDQYPQLKDIDNFEDLNNFLNSLNIEKKFRSWANATDKLHCSDKEWEQDKQFILVQLRALIGRYSALGDKAFYKIYLEIDKLIINALN